MKNIVYDFQAKKVLAIAQDSDSAHMLAECLCYAKYGNSIYGLFQIGLRSKAETFHDYEFSLAFTKFNNI